jgi:peptidoglycan/xylan/chitin deacetylase (PgdA/CDA1 family)
MINFKIHSKALIVKSIIGRIEKFFWRFQNTLNTETIIVLNYHSTPKKFIKKFEKQLLFYKKYFEFISPAQLDEFFDKGSINKSLKPKMLITFDDGLKNNIYAIEVLDRLKIKGLFFIVPDFVNSTNQKDYYLSKIRDFINPNVDSELEDFQAMNWNELDEVSKKGHVIGCHSMSHTMKNTNSQEELNLEIIQSKLHIEEKLNLQVDAFCAPNNSLFSVSSLAKKLINENYSYFHSTFPGDNQDREKQFIKRSNVECFWPLGSVMQAIGGYERKRWMTEIEKYKELN